MNMQRAQLQVLKKTFTAIKTFKVECAGSNPAPVRLFENESNTMQEGGITMNFMELLHINLTNQKKQTENGAIGYQTTGKALVDLNFAVASLRNESETQIVKRFLPAFYEDRLLAVKWLFFLRDVRGGLGERRTFRILMKYLATSFPELTQYLVELMAEYGRFDDLLCLLDTPVEETVLTVLKAQLEQDAQNLTRCESVSLCAKWMPSNNASSEASRNTAAKLQQFMGLTAKEYRKLLASLRAHLNVTEVYMSENRWTQINYAHVASRSNILYRNAFLRHDEIRRKNYLEQVRQNKAVIHAGVLMPHEIVSQYTTCCGWRINVNAKDAALEALWKSLPNKAASAQNILCVVDGSGSMLCPVGNGNTTALHVANALGIYFSERMHGAFRNKFITFSEKPRYVNLTACRTLKEKLELALSHNDCTNTNIEATFNLILQTARNSHLKQNELPQTVLIISDMEFDCATGNNVNDTLFETIENRFSMHCYRMPKLVFWNVNSRTNVVPVRENKLGVALVSGFSVNICNMVLSNELDPFTCLKKVLDSERYQKVENAYIQCDINLV